MSDTKQAKEYFTDLTRAIIRRNQLWGGVGGIPLLFRNVELVGEVGEVCNVIKKLYRDRMRWVGSRATVEQLADELGDVVICVAQVAEAHGAVFDIQYDWPGSPLLDHRDAQYELSAALRLARAASAATSRVDATYWLREVVREAAEIAYHYGIDLATATRDKFNATSEKNGLPIYLGSAFDEEEE